MTLAALAFRSAGLADVSALLTLVQAAYRGERSREGWTTEADLLDGQRTDREALAALLADARTRLVLAERAGELLGSVQLTRCPPVVHLGMLSVQPAQQARGVGRALLHEAERWASDEGGATCLRMTVIAQRTELIAWYERRGFVRTGEREPFPYGQPRFGLPRRADLYFEILEKRLL